MNARTSILAAVIAAAVAAVSTVVTPSVAAGSRGHTMDQDSRSTARIAATRARPSGEMQWFRWHPVGRPHEGDASRFGASAVIGLESMRDLASLRARYGFGSARPITALRAAAVSIDAKHLRVLLAKGPADRRIRYVSPLGSPREVMAMPNDPLLRSVDPSTSLPYEWQFAASRVDRALEHTGGDPSIVVGIIDSGVNAVPDLDGKIDGLWSVSPN